MSIDSAARATPARIRAAVTSARGRFVVAVVVATSLDVALDPEHTHIPSCPFHAMTGWQCPFCGSLRAVNALARGHLLRAMQDNLLLLLAAPVFGLLWATRDRQPALRGRAAVPVALAVAAGLFGVVRNLPFAVALRP